MPAVGAVRQQELRLAVSAGVDAVATMLIPKSASRGVVLAHGGGQDGRRRYLSEATALAADDALVILPAPRIRQDEGVDVFASDVRHAVLTERAALAVLLESGAAPNALAFLGHSAGGALGAILRAVEPRLSRIVIFGNGAGPLAKSALAHGLSAGHCITEDQLATADRFDPARFVGVDRRAPLLVQHCRSDDIAPIEAGRTLFDAAAQPKLWAEYDCGHELDAHPRARAGRAAFLAEQ